MALLEAASQFLEQLNSEAQEVMLDVQVMGGRPHICKKTIRACHVAPINSNISTNIPAGGVRGSQRAKCSGPDQPDHPHSGDINQAGKSDGCRSLIPAVEPAEFDLQARHFATFGGGLTLEGLQPGPPRRRAVV